MGKIEPRKAQTTESDRDSDARACQSSRAKSAKRPANLHDSKKLQSRFFKAVKHKYFIYKHLYDTNASLACRDIQKECGCFVFLLNISIPLGRQKPVFAPFYELLTGAQTGFVRPERLMTGRRIVY
jgi:hypothetical protein